ncbi:MAG: DUF2087 domain-containing protein [Thermomicrobiales bacterium]|nr:DUF2087 domain-containing protein [Thermomicrobiales bacterium]
MEKLVRAKLVAVQRAGQSRVYSLNIETLRAFASLVRTDSRQPDSGDASSDEERERAKVIRDFFDGDRLKQIPAQRKKRVIVLQHLVARFEPEREYHEREVNDILRPAHDDVATLRRELVDYGFMNRAGGVYRVARELPQRSLQVGQEITGDETAWLRRLLASAARMN